MTFEQFLETNSARLSLGARVPNSGIPCVFSSDFTGGHFWSQHRMRRIPALPIWGFDCVYRIASHSGPVAWFCLARIRSPAPMQAEATYPCSASGISKNSD